MGGGRRCGLIRHCQSKKFPTPNERNFSPCSLLQCRGFNSGRPWPCTQHPLACVAPIASGARVAPALSFPNPAWVGRAQDRVSHQSPGRRGACKPRRLQRQWELDTDPIVRLKEQSVPWNTSAERRKDIPWVPGWGSGIDGNGHSSEVVITCEA